MPTSHIRKDNVIYNGEGVWSGSPIQRGVPPRWSRHPAHLALAPVGLLACTLRCPRLFVSDTWQHAPSVQPCRRSATGRAAARCETCLGIQWDGRAFRPLLNAHLAVSSGNPATLLRLGCGPRGHFILAMKDAKMGQSRPSPSGIALPVTRTVYSLVQDFTDQGTAPLLGRRAPAVRAV